MVEARTIAAGHDLHGNKAVAPKKALGKLRCIGADQPGCRLLGCDVMEFSARYGQVCIKG